MTSCRRVVLALAMLLSAAAWAGAQPATAEPAAIRGDLPQTRKRLSEAEQKVLNGHAADAIEDLQRILDEAGDDLVTIDGKQYRAARWYAHQILGKLPPDLLKAYQARIDEPARKLLEAGKRDRDVRPLRELLERYFVSRSSPQGLLLLGDLLFERGEFRTAELQWRRLLPGAAADLHYPAAAADPAAVHARIILAAIFQGELERARFELASYRKKHAQASGALAGKEGPYAETLQNLLDRPPRLPHPAGGEKEWPTLGGDVHRSGRAASPMPYHWPTRPTWEADIPGADAGNRGRPPSPPASPPFGDPVVADGQVFLSDGRRVLSFDLQTGASRIVHEERGRPREDELPPSSAEPVACASLTFASGRLYARLGPPVVRPTSPARAGLSPVADSAIACLDRVKEDGEKAPRFREIWRVLPPSADEKAPGVWEGSPLVANRRMWAAFVRFDGGRMIHSVVCFDPADSLTAPDRPAWIAEICDSPMPSGDVSRSRQELLTLAGPNIVFCSNSGAVVAVNAVSGRRAWAFGYPRTARRIAEAIRSPDPAPAVLAGGRIFVAPADGDRVYALDAETGELLWESGLAEGARILGVSRDRLIITVSGQVRGIRALNVRTGSHRPPEGWVQHNGGGILTYGRGLVTDDVIVWPSRNGLYFLNPDSGNPLSQFKTMRPDPLDLLFGNVVYADGVMVVVTPTRVWGYEAIAPAVPRPPPTVEPRAAFEAMIDLAESQLANGNHAEARRTLVAAIRTGFPPAWRAWAAARLLLLTPRTDQFQKLSRDFRESLDPGLLNEWLLTADGRLASLGMLIDRHTGRGEKPGVFPTTPVLPPAHRPADAPALSADSEVHRFVRLPPAAFPLGSIEGEAGKRHLFVATAREFIAFPFEEKREARRVPAGAYTNAADLPGGFIVAAGPYAVALYGDGPEPVWVFRVPDTDPLPAHPGHRFFRGGERISIPQLSSFALSGLWLFARLGDRHLLALDLKGQRVAWVLGAKGGRCFEQRSFPCTPRFESHFLVAGRLIVAQLSHGRRWTIDAETGRIRQGDQNHSAPVEFLDNTGQATSLVPWVQAPVDLDNNRFTFSDGPGLVRLVDLDSGRVKWTYEAERDSSLAGEPPQVRRWGDLVLVAVRRNHGVELDRIESLDGKSTWTGGPVFIDASRLDLQLGDADFSHVYVPAAGKLLALSSGNGKRIWEVELPGSGEDIPWLVRAGRGVVIAHPTQSLAGEPMSEVFDRLAQSFIRLPLPWRLPWLAAAVYDPWTSRTLPVLLFDPETGDLLKKLSIPARGPNVAARFDAGRAVVATGDRVVWLR